MGSGPAEIIDLAAVRAKKRAQSEQQPAPTPPAPAPVASRAYVPLIPVPFMVYFVPVWVPAVPMRSAVLGHA